MAGVLEYLVSEIMLIAGDEAKKAHRLRIIPRHLMLAVRTDEELQELLKKVTFPESGVLSGVHPLLTFKKSPMNLSRANLR